MALLGTVAGQVRTPSTNRKQLTLGSFTYVRETTYNYGSQAVLVRSAAGSTTIEEVIVYTAPPPSNETPGDYTTQIFIDAAVDSNLGRHTKYLVGSNVRCVLKEIRVVNSAAGARTLQIWIAGLHYTYSLAATGSTGDTLVLTYWTMLNPANLIEMQASGSGLAVVGSAVEVVSESA